MSPESDRASKNWYIAQAPAQTADWPAKLLFDSYELDPSDMTWGPTDGGAPTIYRRSFLTAPAGDDVRSPAVIAEFAAALTQFDWSVAVDSSQDDAQTTWLRISTESTGQVDAWQALQTLRGATTLSPAAAAVAGSLTLARVSFIGMPAKEGHAGAAREAVEVLAPAPRWRPLGQVPGRRRPVVALLDTGVDAHGWLSTGDPAANGDQFCLDAGDVGFVPAGPALPARGAGNSSPHDGQLDTHAGHGTFIAGLIRQLAPDARVLSLHAMHGDGVLDEETVNSALRWLLDRVHRSGEDPELFVDVICLAFGYYEQQPSDNRSTADLRQLLGELGDLGVRVVASAGNHGSDAQVLPAAFADQAYAEAGTAPATQLISVGALNPDGSRAAYSNFGDWVRAWAVGTAVMSTMPVFGMDQDATVVAEFDPANLVDGFACWGGTSFAAAVFAGRLAQALVDDADPDGTSLCDVSAQAAQLRAARALAAVSPS